MLGWGVVTYSIVLLLLPRTTHTPIPPHNHHYDANNRGRYIALDMAKGLKYLHEELKFVHADVKSPNILLTAKGTAKLGDFGLVKLLADENDVQHASKMVCSQACAWVVGCYGGGCVY